MTGLINVALDGLFNEWKSSYDAPFVRDGLMLKTDESIDVEDLWLHTGRRWPSC